jgi:hypothetical protein
VQTAVWWAVRLLTQTQHDAVASPPC